MKHGLRFRLLALEGSHKARPGEYKGDVTIKRFDLN